MERTKTKIKYLPMPEIFDLINPPIAIERKRDQAAPRFSRKIVGSHFRKISGGKIYEYDPSTDTIQEVQFESRDYVLGEKNTAKIVMKAGCIYVEAINEKNALRKARGGNVITVVKPAPKISRAPIIGDIDHNSFFTGQVPLIDFI